MLELVENAGRDNKRLGSFQSILNWLSNFVEFIECALEWSISSCYLLPHFQPILVPIDNVSKIQRLLISKKKKSSSKFTLINCNVLKHPEKENLSSDADTDTFGIFSGFEEPGDVMNQLGIGHRLCFCGNKYFSQQRGQGFFLYEPFVIFPLLPKKRSFVFW